MTGDGLAGMVAGRFCRDLRAGSPVRNVERPCTPVTKIDGRAAQMRAVKGLTPIAASLGLILAVTALLWQINQTTDGSHALVYIYLSPVVLIAAVYNGRTALVCADYFLQEPIYSLAMTTLANGATWFVSRFWP